MTDTTPPLTSPSVPLKPRPVCVKCIQTHDELSQALQVRRHVFVDEFGIPDAQEFDQYDTFPVPNGITHFLVSVDRQPIATCRVNRVTTIGAKLERMAVEKVARRKGVGLALLRHIEKSQIVEETRGPFFCYAMKQNELFYRNSGWVVEDGHGELEEVGISHVAMIKRRRPRGCLQGGTWSLSHVLVRTWDILRARRFYSLFGFQDVLRFKTNGLRAVWLQSPYIDQRIELIEVKDLLRDSSRQNQVSVSSLSSVSPGLGHISIDLSRACSDLTRFLLTMQKESIERFNTKLRLLERPRFITLGNIFVEVAFIADADGTVIEMMRFMKRLENRLEFDAEW